MNLSTGSSGVNQMRQTLWIGLVMNSLTWFVTVDRPLALGGQFISFGEWVVRTLGYGLFALAAFAFFPRARKSFADLLSS